MRTARQMRGRRRERRETDQHLTLVVLIQTESEIQIKAEH